LSFTATYFGNDVLGVTAAAAVAAIGACGFDPKIVEKAAREFVPLPHRMQPVGQRGGVKFINDSKATNVAALVAGVRMCDGPVRLIAGGLLKEKSLKFAKKVLANRAKAVYLIGRASGKMKAAWGKAVKCITCGSLDRAVRRAWRESSPRETIILSPGCASFDQFEDFEDRGRTFVRIVKSLSKRGG
jgi:UDP-N-acetylmuramoylalanine--D-glutamate ligase